MWRKMCGWGLHPLDCMGGGGGGSGPTPMPSIKTKSIVVISILSLENSSQI